MPTATLEGCREKHARGSALINRLIELVDEWAQDGPPPHRAHGAFDAASGAYVVQGEIVRPMSDALMWAVLLGDAVHNLRSALDHLIWQLVLLDSGKDGSTENQFPIASSGAGYWSISKKGEPSTRDKRLRGVSKDHQAIIDTFQPYRNWEAQQPNKLEPLAVLRDLSNHDKHRLLHVLIFALDVQGDDDYRLIPNRDAGEQLETTLRSFPEQGIADIMTTRFSCPGPNPDVISEGDLSISPGIETTRLRLTELPGLSEAVSVVIERFAPDFP